VIVVVEEEEEGDKTQDKVENEEELQQHGWVGSYLFLMASSTMLSMNSFFSASVGITNPSSGSPSSSPCTPEMRQRSRYDQMLLAQLKYSYARLTSSSPSMTSSSPDDPWSVCGSPSSMSASPPPP
jgi:hypothetical protein